MPRVRCVHGIFGWRVTNVVGKTLHGDPQNPVDARLVDSPMALQPHQHIGIKADGELLFRRQPVFNGFSKEPRPEGRGSLLR